jgi:transposase InsO family protein
LGYSAYLISVILRKRGISRISEFGVSKVFLRYKTGPKYEKRNKKEEAKFYEKESPWELIHIDDKRTQNVAGESPKQKRYSFKAVDDFTRFKITREYPDKTAKSACDFLRYVVSEIKKIDPKGKIKAVLTDNGKAYTCRTEKGRENHLFEKTCKEVGIKHQRTKIRRPQTNGKVEYTHWLYDKEFYKKYKFLSFKDREEKLREFTNYLNYIKPHMVIGGLTPYERLLKTKNQKILTEESNCYILNSINDEEVMENKLIA